MNRRSYRLPKFTMSNSATSSPKVLEARHLHPEPCEVRSAKIKPLADFQAARTLLGSFYQNPGAGRFSDSSNLVGFVLPRHQCRVQPQTADRVHSATTRFRIYE